MKFQCMILVSTEIRVAFMISIKWTSLLTFNLFLKEMATQQTSKSNTCTAVKILPTVLSCQSDTSLPDPRANQSQVTAGVWPAPFIHIFSLSLNKRHTQGGVGGGEGKVWRTRTQKPRQQDMTNGQFRRDPSTVGPETYNLRSLF